MALPAGTRLGSLEVVSLLGSGGMGEVYKATDTTLKRQVALKVLPLEGAANPDRIWEGERRAFSSGRRVPWPVRTAACVVLACCTLSAPTSLVAQALRGVLPPHPRPRTIGELTAEKRPDQFAQYKGPILGERFALGNGAAQPGTWVVDVLPLHETGAAGTYQLAIQEAGVWLLINEDRTLASQGILQTTNCTATLTLQDGAGVFATIVARRGSRSDYPANSIKPPNSINGAVEPGPRYAPAYVDVTQDGRTYRTGRVDFVGGYRVPTPQSFRLSARDGERVDMRFRDHEIIEVTHRNRKVLNERTLANLAGLAGRLATILGVNPGNDLERARGGCS